MLNIVSAIVWVFLTSAPCFIVAEQAESIDNPMHEAAKRGGTWIFLNVSFFVMAHLYFAEELLHCLQHQQLELCVFAHVCLFK